MKVNIVDDIKLNECNILIEDNILKATDFFGRRFHINFADGRLLKYEIVK